MGMDVYGKNPTCETGSYFRNNIWYWRPLWSYVTDTLPELAGPEPEMGFYNDGYGLDAEGAKRLSDALLMLIANGHVAQAEQDFRQTLADLPMEPCKWCDSTGIRTDEVGVKMGMDTAPLPEHVAIIVGRTHGTCNGCGGLGEAEPFGRSYDFTLDNVREFAAFLRHSGGFEIC